ncbi:MAG: response regulator transcription factor, partial [Mycobacterium sp.]|nr:response regulator transcription factor [Mycobacterium sp.]
MINVLVVDDEQPAVDELSYLLAQDERINNVHTAIDGPGALRLLDRETIDALFLDIRMPGLSGLDIGRVLTHFSDPPRIVFVTAYEAHAVDAFELRAADYLLKPVRPERLAEAIGRITDTRPDGRPQPGEDTIPAELGGVTTFIRRSAVLYAEAQGDYARLYTPDGNYLIRIPLSTLENEWHDAGFARIHRSYLVAL